SVLQRRHGGADRPGARRDAGPGARRPLSRGLPAARDVPVRPGSAASRLGAADPQRALGRSGRRARSARARLRRTRVRPSALVAFLCSGFVLFVAVGPRTLGAEDGYELLLRYRLVRAAARLAASRDATTRWAVTSGPPTM